MATSNGVGIVKSLKIGQPSATNYLDQIKVQRLDRKVHEILTLNRVMI